MMAGQHVFIFHVMA